MDIALIVTDSKLNVVEFSFTKKKLSYFIKRYTCTSNCHENYTGLEEKEEQLAQAGKSTCLG